jgi:hypothetical protein
MQKQKHIPQEIFQCRVHCFAGESTKTREKPAKTRNPKKETKHPAHKKPDYH